MLRPPRLQPLDSTSVLAYFFLVLVCLPEVMPRPRQQPETDTKIHWKRSFYTKNDEDYLSQFGYLPKSDSESMRTHTQMENAVKNLQFFAGINVTGLVDKDTKNLMTK